MLRPRAKEGNRVRRLLLVVGTLLSVVGLVWTAIGVAYIAMMAWDTDPQPLATYGLIFVLVVLVLPGLVVAGIGSAVRRHIRDREEQSEERATPGRNA